MIALSKIQECKIQAAYQKQTEVCTPLGDRVGVV